MNKICLESFVGCEVVSACVHQKRPYFFHYGALKKTVFSSDELHVPLVVRLLRHVPLWKFLRWSLFPLHPLPCCNTGPLSSWDKKKMLDLAPLNLCFILFACKPEIKNLTSVEKKCSVEKPHYISQHLNHWISGLHVCNSIKEMCLKQRIIDVYWPLNCPLFHTFAPRPSCFPFFHSPV